MRGQAVTLCRTASQFAADNEQGPQSPRRGESDKLKGHLEFKEGPRNAQYDWTADWVIVAALKND